MDSECEVPTIQRAIIHNSLRIISRIKEDFINAEMAHSAGSCRRGAACPKTSLRGQTRFPPGEGGRGTTLAEAIRGGSSSV